MPLIRIEYGSPYNVSVKGVEYFDVSENDLDADGNVLPDVLDRAWQEAVNDFMSDTYVDVVEGEDE